MEANAYGVRAVSIGNFYIVGRLWGEYVYLSEPTRKDTEHT